MKNMLYGITIGGMLFASILVPTAAAEELTHIRKTTFSITFVSKPTEGVLPGVEGEYSKPSTPHINTNKRLPQTNEQEATMYPVLGLWFVGVSWSIWHVKKRKEVN